MRNLIALVAIAFGAYIVYDGNAAGLAPMDAVKALVGIGGGSLYLLIANFASAKNAIVNGLGKIKLPAVKLPTPSVVTPVVVPSTPVVAPVKTPEGFLSPNATEINDNIAIVHLRNRLSKANHPEGVELCGKLAAILFTLEVPSDGEEAKDDVADALTPENVKATDVKTKVSV